MYAQIYHTERLILRPLTLEDIPAWEKFLAIPECVEYLPKQPEMTPLQRSEFWMDRQLNRYKENRFGHLAITDKESGIFMGQAGLLSQEVDGESVLEIGYHLFPEYWGKGYATEAAGFLKNMAFKNEYATEVVSIIDQRNQPSQRVAIRNGMHNKKATTYWGLDVFIYAIKVAD